MAKIIGRPIIELNITITLSESEARAMDALVGYGDDAFLEVFKDKLGESYIRDHENGLRSLFESMRSAFGPWFFKVDEARKVFDGKAEARPR